VVPSGEHQSLSVSQFAFDLFRVIQYLPSSLACRLYLLAVLIQTAVDVAIEADILIQFDDLSVQAKGAKAEENVKRLPVYLGIFALAQYVINLFYLSIVNKLPSVFQFILAIDAVVFRNTLQFIFLV